MPNFIQDDIGELQAALATFKTITPPDGVGRLSVLPGSKRIEINWVRPVETYEWHHPDAETKAAACDEARTDALRFLGVWTNRLKTLADHDHKVLKTFTDYEVSVQIDNDDGWKFKACATADMVCEIRPVVDDFGAPVMEEVENTEAVYTTVTKLVPRTEKVCPPSFLAGAADETG